MSNSQEFGSFYQKEPNEVYLKIERYYASLGEEICEPGDPQFVRQYYLLHAEPEIYTRWYVPIIVSAGKKLKY